MAMRRRIGRGLMAVGDVLGDYFAQKQRDDARAEAQKADDARQLDNQVILERMRNENNLNLKFLEQNPTKLAERLRQTRPNNDVANPIAEGISKAGKLEDVDTDEGIANRYRTSGGRETLDSTNITNRGGRLSAAPNQGGASVLAGLQGQAKSKRDMLTAEANQPDTSVEVANEDGSKSTKFVSKRAGGEYTTQITAKQQGINEGAKDLAAVPGKVEATNQTEKGTRAGAVGRASAIAHAETSARLKAELDPKVIAQKLEFEHRKGMTEALSKGNAAQAEGISARNAAVKGLLPTYQAYRKLAADVVHSWAAPRSESTAAGLKTISKVPLIGELASSMLESGHGTLANTVDPELAKKINALNNLTDVLAQGMANAVLGNKGATTENDRRTAKGILVNSFTSVKSAEELIKITDQMFTILPTVSSKVLAENPAATPEMILKAVEAEAQAGNQFEPFSKPQPAPAGAATLEGARANLARRRQRQ